MKKELREYNRPETLLVVTSYPNPANGRHGKREFNAIGEHSERRLPYLAQLGKVLVLAEEPEGQERWSKQFLAQKNLLIARIWKKGNYLSFFKLFLFMLSHKAKSVFVQFEFNVLGGIIPNLIMLVMLGLLRLTGKTVSFELHQVILDVAKLEKHVPIRTKPLQLFFNASLRIYYVLLGLAVNNVIVFEEDLKKRLSGMVRQEKVYVLSLSVVPKTLIPMERAKAKIGVSPKEFTLLVFGFINGYKGIDWIVNALSDYPKVRLIIAGGENPYLKNKPFYKKFYNGIVAEIKKYAHMIHTGFIPDNKITTYYSAANLVVMPYEVFMAASGPFSQALAHRRPIILSQKLTKYKNSNDFSKAMREAGITKDDLFFKLTKDDLIKHVEKARKNTGYTKKLAAFTTNLSEYRSSLTVMQRLYRIVCQPAQAPKLTTAAPAFGRHSFSDGDTLVIQS